MSTSKKISNRGIYTFRESFLGDNLTNWLIFLIFVNKIFAMEKINRLTFLRRTGLSAAALAVGAYGKAEADIIDAAPEGVAKDGSSATVADNGARYEALLADNGRALVNPMMGWTMHFYSKVLAN